VSKEETPHLWHQYIFDAEKTDDPQALRKLIADCARELNEAELRVDHLERQARGLDRVADRAAAAIRKAAAIRAGIAAQAIAELAALLPEAKAQAKKGKPALLRMILRATK
jgi:hypothetical protein